MNSFKQKIKSAWLLLTSHRFLLITTNRVSKHVEEEEDIELTYNKMEREDLVFFMDSFAEEIEEELEIERQMEMSDILGKQMCGMINEINLN